MNSHVDASILGIARWQSLDSSLCRVVRRVVAQCIVMFTIIALPLVTFPIARSVSTLAPASMSRRRMMCTPALVEEETQRDMFGGRATAASDGTLPRAAEYGAVQEAGVVRHAWRRMRIPLLHKHRAHSMTARRTPVTRIAACDGARKQRQAVHARSSRGGAATRPALGSPPDTPCLCRVAAARTAANRARSSSLIPAARRPRSGIHTSYTARIRKCISPPCAHLRSRGSRAHAAATPPAARAVTQGEQRPPARTHRREHVPTRQRVCLWVAHNPEHPKRDE